MIEELKPCPFCGCEVGLVTGDEYFTVRGQHSMACVFLDDEPVATTEEWNTRAALKAGQGEAVGVFNGAFGSDGNGILWFKSRAFGAIPAVGAELYTSPASADAVSVPRELLERLVDMLVNPIHYNPGAIDKRAEELRALLASGDEK